MPDWLTQTREYYAALYLDAVFAYPETARPVPAWLPVTLQQVAVAAAVDATIECGDMPTHLNVVPRLGSSAHVILDYWPLEHVKTPPRTLEPLRGPITRLRETVAVFEALHGLEEDGRLLRVGEIRRKLQAALDAIK